MDDYISQRLEALSPEYRAFVQSDYIAEAAASFGPAAGLSAAQSQLLENGLLLYLLYFLDRELLITFVVTNCEITESDATVLVSAILETLPEGFSSEHDAFVAILEGEIQQSSIPESPTYTTTQEALLREGRSTADGVSTSNSPQ